jgi:solute carrier family 23 (nucleobase transporter), member 1
MRGTQGALMIASTIQMILGFSGLWCNVIRLVWFVFLARSLIEKLSISQILFFRRLLSPLSAVPLISLVGFGLYELGFPGVSFLHVFTHYFLH